MIDEFVAVLTAAGLKPDPGELRDALWLVRHIAVPDHPDQPAQALGETGAGAGPAGTSSITEAAAQPEGSTSPAETASAAAALYAAGSGGGTGKLEAIEARSPAVPALRRQLQLARALRPFKRRVPSETSFVVDETATATRVAEEGIWLPVLRPAPTRWLNLTLIVDTSPSMIVWQRTVAEMRMLAERLGAFRMVRTLAVDVPANASEPLTVRPEPLTRDRAGPGRQPATLIDPTGRQAIIVLTDAVSDAWRDGRMDALLRKWALAAPVAVATVLPQRMWAGTGLRAIQAQIHAPTPGMANAALRCRARGKAIDGIPVPVMELSARWLAQWAQLVAGAPDWRNAALLATASPTAAPPRRPAIGGAAEVVSRFRSAASPTAFRLACYLSAAWLNLPVMRLVQRVMLPESDTAHLAEVFLGGLLTMIPAPEGTADPETAQYDFYPGVRDELNNYLLRDEMLDVVRTTSQFVSERFGQPLDFAALLADPEGAPLPAIAGDGGPPLAYITATVLAKLGGRYRSLLDRLADNSRPAPGGVTPSQADMAADHIDTPAAASPETDLRGDPATFRYSENHQWLHKIGSRTFRMGVTDYAQQAMGDVVYVSLPETGTAIIAGEPIGEIESVRAITEVHSPGNGTITARNELIGEMPEQVNSDPYGGGWLVEVTLDSPGTVESLLSSAEYDELIHEIDVTRPAEEPHDAESGPGSATGIPPEQSADTTITASVPADLRYTPEHEWVSVEGTTASIGITDYASQQLGDIVYVSLPSLGVSVTAGEPCGEIESVKSVSDLYSPVDGEVIEVNTELEDDPSLINAEPYTGGWMFRVRVAPDGSGDAALPPDLLSAAEYEELTTSAG
jgi:glycine cleavage system H protein